MNSDAVPINRVPNHWFPAVALLTAVSFATGLAEDNPTSSNIVSPAPADESTHIEGWGRVIDPTRRATIEPRGDVLVITAPDDWVDNDPSRLVNAPRVTQKRDGAFTVEVSVQHVDLTEPFSVHEHRGDYPVAVHAGTLMLRADDTNLVLFSLVNSNESGKPQTACELQVWEDGERTVSSAIPARDIPTILQLNLYGPELKASFSQDDRRSWKKFKKRTVKNLPPELDVGVSMISNTESGATTKFHALTIRSLE